MVTSEEEKESSVKSGQPVSLRQNYVFNFISQILVLFIPLITTPYLARVLGVYVNGQISFSSSIISYFVLFANFGFTAYGQREIARYQDDKEKRTKVFWGIFILRLFFTILSLSVLLITVFSNAFAEKYSTFILIQSILVFSCAIDPTFYYQGVEDFKSIAIRTTLVKIVCLVLIFSLVKKAGDAWIYLLINGLSAFFSYLAMWPKIIKNSSRIKLNDLHIQKHIVPALLIFLPNLAVTIYSVFDRTMIGLLASNPDYENGCYEQAYKINSVILLLVTVISPIMSPRNAHDFQEGNLDSLHNHLDFSIRYTWLIGLPLIVGTGILASDLSLLYLGDGYDEVPILLQIMSIRYISSGFAELFSNQYFIAIGKEKYCSIATAVAAVVNIIANYFFIQWWGATGAAITTAVSEVLVTTVLAVLFFRRKAFPLSKFFKPAVKCFFASIIMFIPVFLMNHYLPSSLMYIILEIVVGVFVYFLSLILLNDSFVLLLLGRAYHNIINFIFLKKDNGDRNNEK